MLKQLAFTKSKHVLTAGFGALLVLIVVVTLAGMWGSYSVESRTEALLPVAVVGVLVLVLGAAVAFLVTRQIVRSEDVLYREKELAEVTLHSIGEGVITIDAEGHIDYLNPVAEHYTGCSGPDAPCPRLDACACGAQ